MSHALKQLNQRPISFYPLYRELTGSLTAGIYLSQLMYWFSKKDKIFKTDKEITKETTLTEKEIRNAKKLIKKLDFITVSKEGIPSKTYYEINWEKYEIALTLLSPKGGNTPEPKGEHSIPQKGKHLSPKGGNSTPPKGETNKNKSFDIDYTETTTETTTSVREEKITPLNIINFYRENISDKSAKIKEQKSFTAITLKADELEKILIGLKNYKSHLVAEGTEEKYYKSLNSFVEDRVYLDFLEEQKKEDYFDGWK